MDAATLDDVIRRLLEARGGRTARPAQLTDPEIRRLCAAAKDVFLGQPNLLELEAPIKVCGGGSRGPRPRPKRDQRGRKRVRRLEYDEERDVHVDASIVQQRARERLGARKEKMKQLERDAAKKIKYENMTSFANLSTPEYTEMRVQPFYSMPNNCDDDRFWRTEQKILFDEYLSSFRSVVPMQYLEFEKLEKSEYFKEALWVTKKMGLHKIMSTIEGYNPVLIKQFYATVCFGTSSDMPFEWMSGTERCRSNLVEFAQVLEIPFTPAFPNEKKMHVHGVAYDKKKLAPIYGAHGVFGENKNLKLVYNILMRMFRHTLTPKAGNKDQIRLVEVNLMAHAHSVYCNGEDHEDDPIDVMDFIFQEIFKCIMDKKCPLYAPYIMKLILARQPNIPLLYQNIVVHTPAKLQKKDPAVSVPPRGHVNPKFSVPFEQEDDDGDSEGDDNEEDEEEDAEITTTRRGPRIKHASNTYKMHTSREEVHRKFKKASWWQKFSFSRDVDIRHGQYDNYKTGRAILKSNKEVLKEVKKLTMGIDAPQSSQPTHQEPQLSDKTLSYGTWSRGRCDWNLFEDVTSRAQPTPEEDSCPHGKGTTRQDVDDIDDDDGDEDEDVPEASGSDEDSEEDDDYDVDCSD